jgi:hypothetical protein
VRDNLEVEFDSDETIDHFNTPWWNTLHHAVDNGDDAAVNNTLFKEPDGSLGRYAMVTGLIGLEMCHAGDTELHPAWAVAIRVKDDDPSDEVWAMFIRRWGDEGFRSGDQHYVSDLPNNTYTFRLPWRPGASGATIGPQTTFLAAASGASGPIVQSAANQGLLVSFTLLAPTFANGVCINCNRINGELHVNWQGGQGPAPIPGPGGTGPAVVGRRGFSVAERGAAVGRAGSAVLLPATAAGSPSANGAAEKGDPESKVAAFLAKASSEQRARYLALSPKPPVSLDAQSLSPSPVVRIASMPVRNARARRRQYQSVPDPAKAKLNQQRLDALKGPVVR